MYDTIFFLHILGAMAFVSGVAVAGVAFEGARRRRRPAEVAALLALSRTGVAMVGAGVIVAGACGLWLVHLGNWGYGSLWIDLSIGLFVLALALGGAGGRRPRQARLLASRLAAEGATEIDGNLRALLDDQAARWQNYVSLLLVIGIIGVMCFKP